MVDAEAGRTGRYGIQPPDGPFYARAPGRIRPLKRAPICSCRGKGPLVGRGDRLTRSPAVARDPDALLLRRRDIEIPDVVRLLLATERMHVGAREGLRRRNGENDQN